jgi:uncharacterized protein (TIGR02147 family)
MKVFEAKDYKALVNNMVKSRVNNGRGEFKKMSEFLGVSSVLVSQIFKGTKDISIEQGHKLGNYFGFIDLEKRYFVTLISYCRSGTFELKKFYENELTELREKSKLISNRVNHTNILDEKDKAIFYSDWRYSAIRLACDIERVSTANDLSELFKTSTDQINIYLDFLINNGLIRVESGQLKLGPASTHISKESPFVKNHHRNWRLRSIESIDQMSSNEIMYSAPMCTSKEIFNNLNTKILKLIDEFVKDASAAEGEEVYYLNIDLRNMNPTKSGKRF